MIWPIMTYISFINIFTDETVDEQLKLEAIDVEEDIGLELEAITEAAEGGGCVCFGGDIRCNAMFTELLFRLSL